MTWFKNILKKTTVQNSPITNKYSSKYFEGLEAFKIGTSLYKEKEDRALSKERREQKTIAAIEFFDTAIENNYDNPEVFCYRGYCLLNLGYELDALDDFNKCIEIEPNNASYFQHRALTKSYLHDYNGSLLDYEEAIRLSKISNSNTQLWDEVALKMGYKDFTVKLEVDLLWLKEDIESSKNSYTRKERIKEETANQKRRFQ